MADSLDCSCQVAYMAAPSLLVRTAQLLSVFLCKRVCPLMCRT
jgi:hypothetical protein